MITSTGNQKIKHIIQLQKKASLRKELDVYVVEGRKMFFEARPAQLVQVFVSESFLKKQEQAEAFGKQMSLSEACVKKLMENPAAENLEPGVAPWEVVSDNVMSVMSDTKTPQGILCVLKQQHYKLEDMLKGESPRLVFLENLRDPGNLGTILRTGEGAGISGVLLTEGCVDIYNPKTIRSTMGSLYRVPFFYMKEEQLDEVLNTLRKKNLPIYAAALSHSVSYGELSYKDGCVFMIGNEANGLTDEMIAKADRAIHIPMEGCVESLNAAVAAAILMYESYRQTTM